MKETWKKRLWSLSLAILMALTMTGGTAFLASAAERDQEIVVLYTNDVHCGVDDNIGYAGLSLYKKQMLKETPYVTLVDAGDAIQGSPIGTLSDGGYLIDIMNQVGYDFAVPGNHEFDYGMSRFLELSGKLNCGYYSCNFINMETQSPVFAPYKMISYGETQVAYVGVSTPESFTKSTPAYFQDGSGNYIYSFCEDESGKKLYDQVQKTVDNARGAGAEYVILVGHLGENGVTERWNSDSVIKNTNGVDVFIDGHSHETVSGNTVANKDGKPVAVTQTGTKLKEIGKLTIKTDGTIVTDLISEVPNSEVSGTYTVKAGDSLNRIAKRELGSYDKWEEIYEANRDKLQNPNNLTVGMTLTLPGSSYVNENGKAVDTETDRYIKGIQASYKDLLAVVLGKTQYDLTTLNPATGERAVRNAETNLGDLTADAYRYVLGADIGLSNGGGIRANIAAGDITYNDTLAVFPYGNMGCVVEATGQQIKDALEMAARSYPDENGGFLHVSGLTYSILTALPTQVKTDEKGNFLSVNGTYRVTDIMVGDQPLDLNKTYLVASHNYLLKSGGDGLNMFMNCRITQDEVMTDVDLLSKYINAYLGGTVGAEYEDASGSGRIVIK